MDDTRFWLWSTMIFGVANRRIWEALCLYEKPSDIEYAYQSGKLALRLTPAEEDNLRKFSSDDAQALLDRYEKQGICAVGYDSPDYPPQLRNIMNPPAVLYYKGNISCLLHTRTITCVGARRALDYSINAANRICRVLAEKGFVILSGFAVGIDIASQLGAASGGYPTAAVMGCGVDVDYPRDNFRYRDRVLSAGGVFVSEFPPGTPPHSANFPKRNRILAGLGRAAVVFEATDHSGSIITANFALDQGRDVYCLPPGNVFSSNYSGNIMLLREGALPLYGAEDILDNFSDGSPNDLEIRGENGFTGINTFGIEVFENAQNSTEPVKRKSKTGKSKKHIAASAADNNSKDEKTASGFDAEGLSDVQKEIADLLSHGPVHADVLAAKLGMDPAALMTELTELELLGAAKALPGKMYELM